MKFKKVMKICLSFIVFLNLGCASIFNGTKESITVRSEVKGAKIYFNNELMGTDSATFTVSKKNLKSSTIMVKKEGCGDSTTSISTKFDATTLLGILIDFGIISILVVDLGINGAVNEAERTSYLLNPSCG